MEKIILKDLKSINSCYAEINDGGFVKYDNDNQGFIFEFTSSAGGEREDETLQISFEYVNLFHLPLNFSFSIGGKCINEIRVVPESDLENFLPSYDEKTLPNCENYQCYRFFAEEVETDFYIYCAAIKGELILNDINNLGDFIFPCNNMLIDTKYNKESILNKFFLIPILSIISILLAVAFSSMMLFFILKDSLEEKLNQWEISNFTINIILLAIISGFVYFIFW